MILWHHVWQNQLFIGGLRHANGPINVGLLDHFPFLKTEIERIQRSFGIITQIARPFDRHPVAACNRLDAEFLFDAGKILVIFTKQIGSQAIVIIGKNNMAHIRRCSRCLAPGRIPALLETRMLLRLAPAFFAVFAFIAILIAQTLIPSNNLKFGG